MRCDFANQQAYRAIDYIANPENVVGRAITKGCQDGTYYCPFSYCRRDEMAVFLGRAFLDLDSAGFTPGAS